MVSLASIDVGKSCSEPALIVSDVAVLYDASASDHYLSPSPNHPHTYFVHSQVKETPNFQDLPKMLDQIKIDERWTGLLGVVPKGYYSLAIVALVGYLIYAVSAETNVFDLIPN